MKNLLFLLVALLLLWSCNDDNEGGKTIPTLTTSVVTDISSIDAIAGGNITGNATITARGVVWATTADPTIDLDSHTNDGTGTGEFVSAISGLQTGITYHVRAYATTNAGTVYGNDVRFTTGAPKLYICGTEWNATKGTQQCRVWVNGTASFLGDDNESFAQGLFVSGTDVYVAGSTKVTNFRATYWKNGEPTFLTDDTREAVANAIFVKGNDVYVTGYEKNAEGHQLAKYWKNGTAVILPDGKVGLSIVVSGTDVYVAGYSNGASSTRVWKNGEHMTVSGEVTALHVSGNDIYAAGSNWYWKNGFSTGLTEGFLATAITTSGNDVYVSGQNSSNKGVYWKNGNMNVLPSTDCRAKSIFVSGNDIYVVGKRYNDIAYWKNGLETVLSANSDWHNNGMGIAYK